MCAAPILYDRPIIRKCTELDEKDKKKLMPDAAKGLAYLHRNWILHRVIKLDNFLVSSPEVLSLNGKLTDF